ncbi:MAG: flagellar protein FlgN [Desulfobacterales bacterium]|jgi:flagellar biosynthesis/type III secretory pathway chaperone|nr:flagellar protein FlgN [Desulfobacterales bacterium]
MLRSIDELVGVLREQASRCAELQQAAEREYQALCHRRLDVMRAAASEKEAILQGLNGLEQRRAALVERLAAEWQLPAAGLTMESLAQRLPGAQAGRLQRCRDELRERLERLQQVQRRSEALCRGAIDMLQGAHRLLKGFWVGAPVYRGDGGYPAAGVSGHIVRGEV